MKHRPGRPRRETTPVIWNIKLLLYPGEDDDLILLKDSAGSRRGAAIVMAAMRNGGLVAPVEQDNADEGAMFEALAGMVL